MPFSVTSSKTGETYILHCRETPTRSGTRKLYFFAREARAGALEALPPGYKVVESPATGLPLLKKE